MSRFNAALAVTTNNKNAMNQHKTTIDNRPILVNDSLKDWTIYPLTSSFVAYIAVNPESDALFFQFNNGTCFKYPDVPIDLIHEAVKADSIGKWFHAQIKGKYEGEALESHCIQLDTEEDDIDGIFLPNMFDSETGM